ncbi:hypothetical protein COOONC_18010 [Cooperia oncophora]
MLPVLPCQPGHAPSKKLAPTPLSCAPGDLTLNLCMAAGVNRTRAQESWAIAIVAISALLGNFPVVHLVNKVGIRTVFASLGILSAISTLLIPTTIRVSILGYSSDRVFIVWELIVN